MKHTRAIIDAILDGSLDKAEFETMDIFGLAMPKAVPEVPSEVLNPRSTWQDGGKFDKTAVKLATMFNENFKKYSDQASEELLAASPKIPAAH